jgi:hypothetical protein
MKVLDVPHARWMTVLDVGKARDGDHLCGQVLSSLAQLPSAAPDNTESTPPTHSERSSTPT